MVPYKKTESFSFLLKGLFVFLSYLDKAGLKK